MLHIYSMRWKTPALGRKSSFYARRKNNMQKKFQKRTLACRLIYWLAFMGLFFMPGCVQNTTTVVESAQPHMTQEARAAFFPGDFYYYYLDGERVQLIPSLDWISVQFVSTDSSVQIGILQKYAGLLGPLDRVRKIPAPEISLLPLPNGTTLQK